MTCRSFEGQGEGGQGSERGRNGKGGREHITRHRGKQGTHRECHVACSPPRYSLSLWLSMWAGRNGDRKQPPPPTLPPFIPSHPPSALHSLTPPVTHHPTFHHVSSLPLWAQFLLREFPNHPPPPPSLNPHSVSPSHRRA